MNNEVAEFLRRAAQRRAQVEAQVEAQAKAQAEQQARAAAQQQAAKNRPVRSLASQQQPVDAEIIDLATISQPGNRISSQVSRDLAGSQQLGRHAEHLADKVEKADDDMEAHLHKTFDHQVGTMKSVAGDAKNTNNIASVVTAAFVDNSPVAKLLRDPQSIRNAIIMNEILTRPTDRW